jgi:hypothetical protein
MNQILRVFVVILVNRVRMTAAIEIQRKQTYETEDYSRYFLQ